MDSRDRSTLANVVGWIALIVSIVALVLAWTAYNNASEENLGDMIQNQVEDVVPTTQQAPIESNDSNLNDSNMNDADGTNNSDTMTPGTNDGTVNGDTDTLEGDAVRPEAN